MSHFKSLIVILLVAVVGCDAKKESTSSDLAQSYRLIDQDRPAEAVVLLEEALAKNPEDSDVKVALASAYASLAGVDVPKLFPAIETSILKKSFKELSASLKEKKAKLKDTDNSARKTTAAIETWLNLFQLVSLSFDTFNQIVTVDRDNLPYLQEAIILIDGVPQKTRGNHLFQAILRVVAFKSELINNSLPSAIATDENGCQIVMSEVPSLAKFIGKSVEDISTNLSLAYPKQAKSYRKSAEAVKNAADSLAGAANNLSNFDEISNSMAIKMGIEQNVGKILECN